jgi:hypothetical protein
MTKNLVFCVLLSLASGLLGFCLAYARYTYTYDSLVLAEDHDGLVQLEKHELCRSLVYDAMDKPCPEMEGFNDLSGSEKIEQTHLCEIWADKGSQYSFDAAMEVFDECENRHGGGREIYHCYQKEPLIGER